MSVNECGERFGREKEHSQPTVNSRGERFLLRFASEVQPKSQFRFPPRVCFFHFFPEMLLTPRVNHRSHPRNIHVATFSGEREGNSHNRQYGLFFSLHTLRRFESHERSHRSRKSHVTRRFLERFSLFSSPLARMFLELFSDMGENRATGLLLINMTRRYLSLSVLSGAMFICLVDRVLRNSRSTSTSA